MDQGKIGGFLKALRSERGLTQEQLAEKLNVSERSISRWETGRNLPDIGMLAELADFFAVSIPEIIDGERKTGEMDQQESLLKVADYSEQERNGIMKNVLVISIAGLAALLLGLLLVSLEPEAVDPLLMCLEGICFGLAVGALLTSVFFAAGILAKIRSSKKSRRIARILRVACPIFVAICIAACTIITVLQSA